MAYYRLYLLDHEDRTADAIDFTCDTDEQAVAKGREQAAGHKFEIWQIVGKAGVIDDPAD
jgi:hypothetical protein